MLLDFKTVVVLNVVLLFIVVLNVVGVGVASIRVVLISVTFFFWSDLSTTSRCFGLCYSPPTDGSDMPPPNMHPIWTLPGMTRFRVLWDSLLGLDLGPTGHVNGNILLDLLELPALGATETSGSSG